MKLRNVVRKRAKKAGDTGRPIPEEELFAELVEDDYRVRACDERYIGPEKWKAVQTAKDGITAYWIEIYEEGCRDFFEGWERFRRECPLSVEPEIQGFEPLEFAMNKWRWILGDQSTKKPWELYRRDWMQKLEAEYGG